MLRAFALLLAAASYQDGIVRWRAQKEVELKADGGWLTVTGFFWLKEGANRFPAIPGSFEYYDGKTLFRPDPAAHATSAGKSVSSIEMGLNTAVDAGELTVTVIERGGASLVRLRDKQSKLRKEFRGRQWFPVREPYRIQARFVAQPKHIPIVNIIGNHFQMESPGYVVFQIEGREMRLEPVIETGEKELFFIFRDQTAGKETYPAGRFLYAALPRDGKVELDFNKAESPPCAFTPYATCPLPPEQNKLPIRIEAGERIASTH